MSDPFAIKARPHLAVGPETPGWGSWEWVGADLVPELGRGYETAVFGWDSLPDDELLLVVKHPMTTTVWRALDRLQQIVYCPIDHYGSAAEIDQDAPWLRRCARIVVHCEKLRKYFAPYAPVEYIDHHVKFAGPLQPAPRPDGPLLWVGVRSNLPPLVDWVNEHELPRNLLVLTNPEDPSASLDPARFGFRDTQPVRIERWSPERHLELLPQVAGALDIKGDDFRQRHKPPAKAIDYLAAGVPLAMNAESSSVEHLARLGFDLAEPDDIDHWLSFDYWEECGRFGSALRELLSRERIARRYGRIFKEVLAETVGCGTCRTKRIAGLVG